MRLACVLVLFSACARDALDVTRRLPSCADGCDLAPPADGGAVPGGDDLSLPNLSGIDLAGVTLLDGLSLSDATLSFSPIVSDYRVHVGVLVTSLTVTATAAPPRTLTLNGAPAVSGVPAPFTLANGDNTITVEVDGPFGPRSYHVVITRGGVDYLKGTPADSSKFGFSVALSATTLAVASYDKQLYIFHRASDGTWSQEAQLGGFGDVVEGLAVDSSGDFVFANDSPATGEVVRIYTRSGGTWTQAGVLPSPDSYHSLFGFSLAVSGDTLAVGEPNEASDTTGVNPARNTNGQSSGAVWVYRGSGASWSTEAFLKASNTGLPGFLFGATVALDGDILAASAPNDASNSTGINSTPNGNAFQAGAVYVFGRSGTSWSQQAYVKPSRPLVSGSCFGCNSVAVLGNVLAVGVLDGSSIGGLNPSGYDQNAAKSGAVYLFMRAGTAWSQTAFLKLPHPAANDNFGNAVALDGNLLAVGAPGYSGSGAVFLFDSSGSGTAGTEPPMLVAPNPGSTDVFGFPIALSHGTLAVSAPQEDGSGAGINPPADDNGKDTGAVYVY
jgi:hypothetical protein